MSTIQIDHRIAHAAATDAANRQMRRSGRIAWSEDDYNLACQTQAELLGYLCRLLPGPIRLSV